MTGAKIHKVSKGDCIANIAYKYGFFPDAIWNHADNSDLKRLRKDPNLLLAGDIVSIPEKTINEVTKSDGQRHLFRRKGVPEKLKIQFKDEKGPRANESYTLTIDGVLFKGKTDSDGRIEQPIPPYAKEGSIMFRHGEETYTLNLGHLDPIETVSGIQGRLRNLGYYTGRIDGSMNPSLIQAIQEFQLHFDLEPDGEISESFTNKLKTEYSG